jgi:peptide/nickel transport system substrate-binding protein
MPSTWIKEMVMSVDSKSDFLIRQELTRLQLFKRVGAAGIGLSVPGLLAACGGDEEGGPAATGAATQPEASEEQIENITWAIPAAIRGLDIAKSFDTSSSTAISLALETLVTYTADLQLVEELAESWEAVDAVTYVYQIRQGVTFWDGSPLTAEDVAFSMSRHLNPDTGSQIGSYFGSVDAITATGPNEVTVKLKTADPFWQYVPTFVQICPQAFIEAQGENFGTPGAEVTVMGTGPYQVTSFSADEGVTMEPYADYWGEKPLVQNIDLRFLEDPQTRLLAMRAGEIDGSFDVPLNQADDWDAIEGVTVNSTPGLRVWFYSFDQETEPWNDIHVRRAFAHAIDREGIVQSLLGGYAEPANAMAPPDQWKGLGLPEERVQEIYAGLRDYEFSIDMAREELAQSSVPNGFEASVQYPDSQPELGRATQSLAQNLREIGITLDVREVTSQKWLNDLYEHKNLGLQALGYGPDYPDPGNFIAISYHSDFAVPNAFNLANYKNPRVDELLDQQAASTDPEERATALAEIMTISQEELPYLNIWWEDAVQAFKDEYVYEGFIGLWYSTQWIRNLKRAA